MGCGSMGGCGDSAHKSSNHSPKKAPNWGMNKMYGTKKSNNSSSSAGNFGSPRVRMSFSGKARRGY